MSKVTLKNINKIYENGFQAVYDFNLEIADEEFVVFVGPSGCGKSTTLRMVAGLEEITSGELYIGDTLVNDVEPKNRDIAMVFQNYALYPHMTVKDNMSYALRVARVPKAEIDQKVQAAAKILGLEDYLDNKPKELSGGQRQRVALGRAIVRNPKVFLMDEPLSNLDAKLRIQMRAEIIKLHENLKTTFIYVTHDQTEAMTMGDRIVIMKDGYIQQVDKPDAVYFKPYNLFVAGFIGSPQMNFIDGQVSLVNEKYQIDILGQSLPIPADKGKILEKNGYLDKDIIMGIRPEHIYASDRPTNMPLEGRVDFLELLGSEHHVHLMVNDQEIVARINSDVLVEREKSLDVFIDPDKIHFFDPETELNVSLE